MTQLNPFTKFHILKRLVTRSRFEISSLDGECLWPRDEHEEGIARAAKSLLPPSDTQIQGEELTAFINLCEDLWEEAYGESI